MPELPLRWLVPAKGNERRLSPETNPKLGDHRI